MNQTAKGSGKLYALVLSHYVVAAVSFAALVILLLWTARDLFGHYFHPHILAVTHLAALGWGTTIIFGACYQLIPVIFEKDLVNFKLPWFSIISFTSGIVLLIPAFWVFDPGLLMQAGALLVLLGIVLFCISVFLSAYSTHAKNNIYQEFIVTSTIWLLLTAVVGVLLVFNFRYAFLPKDHLLFLKMHAHLGVGGWFLLLIIGVSAKLIPMFLVSRKQNEKLLSWSYYLINGALLLFVIDTWFFGINSKTLLIAFVAFAGIGNYLIYVFTCFQSRLKKKIELPITNTIISFLLLGLALVSLPFIIYFHLSANVEAVRMSNLYGALLFMGWISSLILGQTFKTLPFIVWAKKYESLAGRVKTPLPADLYKPILLKVQTVAYVLFCFSFFTGLLFQIEMLLYGGLIALLVVAFSYLINVLIVVFHKSSYENL